MNVEGWRAYYTDGRAFDSATHDWVDLPDDGLLVLVIYYDRWSGDGTVQQRMTLDGDDHYFHVPGTELFGCNNDPIEEIERRFPGAVVKRGKWTEATEFYYTKERARSAGCPE